MSGTRDEVSEDARQMAARARQRAMTEVPDAESLAELMTAAAEAAPEEMRRRGAVAVRQAQQMSYLLGQLAGLLGDEEGAHA